MNRPEVLLSCILFFFFGQLLLAQDVLLRTQSDVNNFDAFTTIVHGHLIVSEEYNSTDRITDLSNLSNLDSIQEDFQIVGCRSLVNLDELSGLSFVGGHMSISGNEALESVASFLNLNYVSSLTIRNNDGLESVAGFPQLNSDHIEIANNDALRSINGFLSLTVLPVLQITNNDELESIEGFPLVDSIFVINLEGNSLKNLEGLSSLEVVGKLEIRWDKSLENLNSFRNLRKLDNLYLWQNVKLSNLDGLENLDFIGAITIYDNNQLLNIDGLQGLTLEQGLLNIRKNSSLKNINGLVNITSLDGLTIFDNDSLTSIDGLTNLEHTRILFIREARLTSLHGLSNLSRVDEYLEIQNCNALVNLDGLEKLTHIGKELLIYSNPLLQQLDGLLNLESSGMDVIINDNFNLEQIDGLNKLERVGNLILDNNYSVNDISGLSGITIVQGDLLIQELRNLLSLNGIQNIEFVGGNLTIRSNTYIGDCCNILPLIVFPNAVQGAIDLRWNSLGCRSVQQILDYGCTGVKVAQGNVRIDIDKNGCDSTDATFEDLAFDVFNNDGAFRYSSNNSSTYFVGLDSGANIVVPDILNNKLSVSPDTLYLEWPDDQQSFSNDFCVIFLEDFNDLAVSIVPLQAARPGFESGYLIEYTNYGSQPMSGEVNFTWPDVQTTILSADPLPNVVDGNMISWFYSNLQPFETRPISVVIRVNSPMDDPPVNGGEILTFTTSIDPIDEDDHKENNTYTLNQTVVNSFDPNDKTCLDGPFLQPELIGDFAHYLIRFENTGTANAIHVKVQDSIDARVFDINTLVMTSSSHSCHATIDGDVVTFAFDYINLPFDDFYNDGFVAFKIKTRDNLSIGDSLTNKADIYFDFNFPIRTNTARTDVMYVATTNLGHHQENISIYPNPTNDRIVIECGKQGKYQIQIIDVNGHILRRFSADSQFSTADVRNLPDGLYIVHVIDAVGQVNTTKFFKY